MQLSGSYNVKQSDRKVRDNRKATEEHMKKRICLDFDGVVHSYQSPWVNAWTIPDGPVDGAIAWIYSALNSGGEVSILSARSRSWRGRRAMRRWLREHAGMIWHEAMARGLDDVKFPKFKPPSHVYIDDRAHRFNGKFPYLSDIEKEIPWNKKGGLSKPLAALPRYGEVAGGGGAAKLFVRCRQQYSVARSPATAQDRLRVAERKVAGFIAGLDLREAAGTNGPVPLDPLAEAVVTIAEFYDGHLAEAVERVLNRKRENHEEYDEYHVQAMWTSPEKVARKDGPSWAFIDDPCSYDDLSDAEKEERQAKKQQWYEELKADPSIGQREPSPEAVEQLKSMAQKRADAITLLHISEKGAASDRERVSRLRAELQQAGAALEKLKSEARDEGVIKTSHHPVDGVLHSWRAENAGPHRIVGKGNALVLQTQGGGPDSYWLDVETINGGHAVLAGEVLRLVAELAAEAEWLDRQGIK